MQKPVELPGYSILSCLWRHTGRVAYSARQLADGTNVTIETLDADYPDRRQVAALQHEVSITARLKGIAGVRRIQQTITHGSGNLALIADHYDSSWPHC